MEEKKNTEIAIIDDVLLSKEQQDILASVGTVRSYAAVANVPRYASIAVAEHAFGILLSLVRHVPAGVNRVKGGNFSWHGLQGVELYGKTIGVIGVGAIGQKVTGIARGFGMQVVGTAANISPQREQKLGIQLVALEELLEISDVVLLACPLTTSTRGMINSEVFKRMKSSAYIVNVARHEIVVQADLSDALKSGQIAGAALDEIEFPDQKLLSLENVVVTPHLGFYTSEALIRKGDICVQNVKSFLNGRPENLVN